MVREVDISLLNEATYNPRIPIAKGSYDWEQLETSIKTFGNVQPIVWNEQTGNVVGGHQRLAVLKDMGYDKVPCSVVNLPEYEEKLLNVALNKIKGRWDYSKLADILREFDFETATVSGFSEDEIALILANNSDLIDGEEDYGDWFDDSEEEVVLGGNYVVTLVFDNIDEATRWATKEGYAKQIKENTNTTVIRVE